MVKVCLFDGCDKKEHSRGYCVGHYTQLWRGVPLKPLREKRVHTGDAKECIRCRQIKPNTEFYLSRGYLSSHCKPCKREVVAERKQVIKARKALEAAQKALEELTQGT